MIVGIAETIIIMGLIVLPAAFVALTIKVNAPITAGVPVIAPVDVFKLKPVGRLPLAIAQVIGVVPVALSV